MDSFTLVSSCLLTTGFHLAVFGLPLNPRLLVRTRGTFNGRSVFVLPNNLLDREAVQAATGLAQEDSGSMEARRSALLGLRGRMADA